MRSFYQVIAKLVFKHMPEKLRNRVHFHSNFSEIDDFDIKDFPVACGGEVPNADFIGEFLEVKANQKLFLFVSTEPLKKTLSTKRDFFLNYNNMKIDLKLYPEDIQKCKISAFSKKISK